MGGVLENACPLNAQEIVSTRRYNITMETSKQVPMVTDHLKFIQSEVYAINWHIAAVKFLGDPRPENEIALEWIQDNAERFRADFIMASGF